MPRIGYILACGSLALLMGCANSKWGFVRPQGPTNTGPTPTSENLVRYLNLTSSQVQTVHCKELDMEVHQGITMAVNLRGQMACEKPRNFRLNAAVVSNPQVDIGSNDKEFWFWLAKGEPPYLYHCSYQDLSQGAAKLPFPIQPEWIMECLGMGQYGPPENYQVRVNAKTVELVQQSTSAMGQTVRKITVFDKNPSRIQVMAHMLQDANGKMICAAYVTDVQTLPGGVTIPRRVRFEWPAEKVEMKMKLDDVVVNQQFGAGMAATVFTRPNLTNIQSYDLARGLDQATTQVRPAGGFMK